MVAAYKKTPAAKVLEVMPRWDSFFEGEPLERRRKVLGATAYVEPHQNLFTQMGRRLLEKEPRLLNHAPIVLGGFRLHDLGESSKGDKSAQIKTVDDEKNEHKVAIRVFESMPLPAAKIDTYISNYRRVVMGEDPELKNIFPALEQYEYLNTAFNLHRYVKNTGEKFINSTPMVARVLVINGGKLLTKHVPNFPNSIGAELRRNADLIDEMYVASLPWLQETKEWGGKPVDHAQLASAFNENWNNFLERAYSEP